MDGQAVSMLDELLGMSNRALYTLLASTALPWVIALIVRSRWAAPVKVVTTLVICMIATMLYLVVTEQWHSHDWLRMTLLVFVGTTLMYRLFHRPVTAVERATG